MKTLISIDKNLFLFIYNSTNSTQVKKVFNFITKISKPFFMLTYALLLLFLFITSSPSLLIVFIKPLFVLILCKILRKLINRKRPYLVFKTLNLPKKEDASLPSNHTASSFIISFMFLYVYPPLGIIMIALAVLVSLSRIIIGIHFPLDILSGFLISLIIFLV